MHIPPPSPQQPRQRQQQDNYAYCFNQYSIKIPTNMLTYYRGGPLSVFFLCIHIRFDVPLWIQKGYAFPVELRRIELIMSVLSLRKLKPDVSINRFVDHRELSVCIPRFFHSRFNSTSVLWGPMGDSNVHCFFSFWCMA